MFVVTKKILLSEAPVTGLSINILPLNIDEPDKLNEPVITNALPSNVKLDSATIPSDVPSDVNIALFNGFKIDILAPDEPDVPSIPDEPEVPSIPDEPEVPSIPDVPDDPGVPAISTVTPLDPDAVTITPDPVKLMLLLFSDTNEPV